MGNIYLGHAKPGSAFYIDKATYLVLGGSNDKSNASSDVTAERAKEQKHENKALKITKEISEPKYSWIKAKAWGHKILRIGR